MAEDDRRGDARIVIYLNEVNEGDIDRLTERVCDLLSAEGFAVPEDDGDAPLRSLVGVRAEAFPDLGDDDATKAFLEEHATFSIPVTPASERTQ